MVTHNKTFSKSERLCSKKVIEALFQEGRSFYCAPFFIVWAYSDSDMPFPAQVAISVPKKVLKLAVTRNLIKRRTKEAYRVNKDSLYEFLLSLNKKIVFTMIFRDDSLMDFLAIEISVKKMIKMFTYLLVESKSEC
jgi:ribonuclease P protein component